MSVEQHRADVGQLLAELIEGGSPGRGADGRPATATGVEVVPVGEALGRVLADDVVAPEPLPRFRNSQMDGFAVRAADVAGASADAPVVLPVAGEIAARPGRPEPLAPGSAVRIMTGAPVPHGADAVVPVEDTDMGTFNREAPRPPSSDAVPGDHGRAAPGDRELSPSDLRGRAGPAPTGADPHAGFDAAVQVRVPRTSGDFVRESGSDVGAGDLVLPAGTVLAPHHVAAAAACGIGELPVRRRIRVAIVSTGSELVAPGEPAGPGQIWDANAVALAAAVRAAGGVVAHTERVGDDEAAARETLRRAASSADVVITSGGVSQGAHEVVKEVLADVVFRPVAMQPGGPQGFGRLDGTPVLTFPGNPVSTQVSFVVFLRDLLRRAGGLPPVGERRAVVGPDGLPDGGLASPSGKRQFLRGRVREGRSAGGAGLPAVDAVGGPGSHLVASMAAADVLIDVPAEVTGLNAGDEVTILPL
ncbi:gephyrin-like molybdotransferase Glp [Myceligenerans pegani]|uniref:Molybdopterin molybdenumtransferase n=1 Tax=Myceligenerans pegani TaxID=2776917 RepID=A0ABR9N164_9MICO|nr:gephyrin-like molybdotransferase Glp [Myceligenerans sp. TRM 65318]MBE1877395.1 molybdopterin molybdotransferase MoeA [Myceligenerans sp. TRM 65318]MBE3019666.1 molybdopterin molybdotransferase MoeA [Myceligenerans sp. TRM 65318]